MDIGAVIRDARLSKGWSPRELGWRADVAHVTIVYIESGQTKNPGIQTVIKLLRACGKGCEVLAWVPTIPVT